MDEHSGTSAAPEAGSILPALPRCRWVPTLSLLPGMVIERPVVGGAGMLMTMHLGVGSVITTSTIAQIINKGVECVAVRAEEPVDAAAFAEAAAAHAARLHEIFGPAPDEHCLPLLNVLLEEGPALC